MRLSRQLFQDRLGIPEGWKSMQTYKLLEACGFVEFPYSGIPTFLPIGRRMVRNICDIIKEESEAAGFSEVYLPLLQHRKLLESTGRAESFSEEFMTLSGNLEGLIISPTNEEVYLDLARRGLKSYRQLPILLFQIADKFRDIKKPKGILRSKQFLMCDMVSIDASEESLRESARRFEGVASKVFARTGLNPYRIVKEGGNYVDYLVLCPEGETKIIVDRTNARYAEEKEADAPGSSSVAMYFIFNNPQAHMPGYLSKDGRQSSVFLGTYGFGIQRCLHAIVEMHRDDQGINFPGEVRPFDISIIVIDPGSDPQMELGLKCHERLLKKGLRSLLDDRHGRNLKDKTGLSDFYGTPYKIIIGEKECDSGFLTLKRRGSKESTVLPLDSDWEDISRAS
jgi:prolyl-tRNA synthetase